MDLLKLKRGVDQGRNCLVMANRTALMRGLLLLVLFSYLQVNGEECLDVFQDSGRGVKCPEDGQPAHFSLCCRKFGSPRRYGKVCCPLENWSNESSEEDDDSLEQDDHKRKEEDDQRRKEVNYWPEFVDPYSPKKIPKVEENEQTPPKFPLWLWIPIVLVFICFVCIVLHTVGCLSKPEDSTNGIPVLSSVVSDANAAMAPMTDCPLNTSLRGYAHHTTPAETLAINSELPPSYSSLFPSKDNDIIQ